MTSRLTVLVVGATGTIGKELVTTLAGGGFADVRVGSRSVEKAAAAFAGLANVTPVALDLDRAETYSAALAGATKVFQVSALAEAMVRQTNALAEMARAVGVKHFVRSSLFGADDAAPIREGEWHLAADRALQASGIPFTLLRPNQYFQNFSTPANGKAVRERSTLAVPLADSRVSNIDTRDIAACAARILVEDGTPHAGKTYVLTGPEAVTMDEIARAVGAAIGKSVSYVAVTEEQTRERFVAAGMPAESVEAVLEWFAYCRSGRAAKITADTEQLLGTKPRTVNDWARDYRAVWA
jgi:uncharacterized protein YbjT (DUF2867 family)